MIFSGLAILLTSLIIAGNNAAIAADSDTITVSSVEPLGIEIKYSFDISERNFCVLVVMLEEEYLTRAEELNFGIRYRFLRQSEPNNDFDPQLKVQPFEKFFVKSFGSLKELHGAVAIYSDEIPDVSDLWVQIYTKGFDCSSGNWDSTGLTLDEVDLLTLAPKSVPNNRLIEFASEAIRMETK